MPEAAIFSCSRRPQDFLGHMSRFKWGRMVNITIDNYSNLGHRIGFLIYLTDKKKKILTQNKPYNPYSSVVDVPIDCVPNDACYTLVNLKSCIDILITNSTLVLSRLVGDTGGGFHGFDPGITHGANDEVHPNPNSTKY